MRIVIALLIALPLFGAPKIDNYTYQWFAPKTFIAGFHHKIDFTARYTFTFTCDSSTDVCTADGTYTLVNGVTAHTYSSGTLPGGKLGYIGGKWEPAAICEISGNTFKWHRTNCSGQVIDITSAGTGTHTAAFYDSGNNTYKNIYFDNLTLPSGWSSPAWRYGTVSSLTCNAVAPKDATTQKFVQQSDIHMCIDIYVPPNATMGANSFSFRMCQANDGATNCNTWNWNVTVVDPSTFPTPAEPPSSAFTAIPGLSAWEARMINGTDGGGTGGGAAWCDKANVVPQAIAAPACAGSNGVQDIGGYSDTVCGGSETSVWYYDGTRVYAQIADYTRDAAWNKCANYVGIAGRDYIHNSNGSPAWRTFGTGMEMMASRSTGKVWDGRYYAAAKMLSNHTQMLYGPAVNPAGYRELAYAVMQTVKDARRGKIGTYHQDIIDAFISQSLIVTEKTGGVYEWGSNIFMIGLGMEALEDLYAFNHDKRVPYVMKRLCDLVVSAYQTTPSHSAYYNNGVSGGSFCFNSGDMPWFGNLGDAGGCSEGWYSEYNTPANGTYNRLNNLFAHGFAWMWRYFYDGTNTYRDLGDDMFQYGLGTGLSAKEFSQNYRNSFRYVRWRSGR